MQRKRWKRSFYFNGSWQLQAILNANTVVCSLEREILLVMGPLQRAEPRGWAICGRQFGQCMNGTCCISSEARDEANSFSRVNESLKFVPPKAKLLLSVSLEEQSSGRASTISDARCRLEQLKELTLLALLPTLMEQAWRRERKQLRVLLIKAFFPLIKYIL